MFSKLKTIRTRKQDQKGLSLIEASMVLALSAVVVAGVMMYYQSASDNNKLQSAISELGGIQTAVQTYVSGQGNFYGVSNSTLSGSNSIPPNFWSDSNTINNPWSGMVIIAQSPTTALTAASVSSYTVEYDNLPGNDCQTLATESMGSVLSLNINGTPVSNPNKVDATTAKTSCNNANNQNIIKWEFH